MAAQNLPSAAVEYGRDQRLEISGAVAALSRQWRRMGADFDAGYVRLAPVMTEIVRLAQARVVTSANRYIPNVLEDTRQLRWLDAEATVNPFALVGVAGDGRPVESLLYGAVIQSKTAVGSGQTVAQALKTGGDWLSMASGTALSDTARAAESTSMGVRRVTGYVRMLSPPSCARCIVLGGAFYKFNSGFQRHPRCDCRHIPAAESLSRDLTVNRTEYFNSTSAAEQDRTFGKAGAEAIRNGADMGQVVNARRGMSTAQDGRLVTTTGTSRNSIASARNTGRVGARLMPETIAKTARNHEDYMRLMKINGYIF